jgi:Fe2+ or Zn2+ uptake regulation protein
MVQVDLVDRADRYLLDHGLRLTKARRLLIRSLARHPGPRSAAQLDEAMGREIPLSSIYRTLMLLEQCGLLAKQRNADGIAKYELGEIVTGDHHHHFVCTRCGGTEEITIPESLERAISELADAVEGDRGSDVTGHSLELEGVCEACRVAG